MSAGNKEQLAFRWDPYVFERGTGFESFWREHLQRKRDALFIVGAGFDPRTALGCESILTMGGEGRRDLILVNMVDEIESPTQQYADLAEANKDVLRRTFSEIGNVEERDLMLWASDGGPRRRRVGSLNARSLLVRDELLSYTDVIVDISAFPRGIYFPLLAMVLYTFDERARRGKPSPNLHVVVAEDAAMDKIISAVGPDDTASYVPGFSAGMELQAAAETPKLWIPILGESQEAQLGMIHAQVLPDEICPLLPSPSSNPRRGDELVIEYQRLLFDEWRVEPSDIVYASEQNPFEVYRQVLATVDYHRQALQPLGGCRAAVSAMSSKLLSLGALLAAYDSKSGPDQPIALAHVDVSGYEFDRQVEFNRPSELFTLWLSGECYE